MYDEVSLAKAEPVIRVFSEMEGLAAHGRSASIRLEKAPAAPPKSPSLRKK
jgi:histidinol dehydrogenase